MMITSHDLSLLALCLFLSVSVLHRMYLRDEESGGNWNKSLDGADYQYGVSERMVLLVCVLYV